MTDTSQAFGSDPNETFRREVTEVLDIAFDDIALAESLVRQRHELKTANELLAWYRALLIRTDTTVEVGEELEGRTFALVEVVTDE
jgi:hypothetical protein